MKNKFFKWCLCAILAFGLVGCSPSDAEVQEPLPPVAELPERPETPNSPEEPTLPEEPAENPSAPETPAVPEEPAPEEPVPPAPEPPAKPAAVKDTLLASTVNGLQVRSGAGTNYGAMGALDASDMAMPVRTTGNWYEVLYKNKTGYVSAAYVTPVGFTAGSRAVENVIDVGKQLLGLPYVFGAQRYHWGNGIRNTNYDGKSYDCSSLMQYIFKIGAGVDLAMTSREQSVQGTFVAKKDIRRGDLLFFTNASRQNKTGVERIGHVALYLGDNVILHTASDHAVIEPMSAQRHAYYISARRVL